MRSGMHHCIDPVSHNTMLSEFNSTQHFYIVLPWIGGHTVPPGVAQFNCLQPAVGVYCNFCHDLPLFLGLRCLLMTYCGP